MDNDAVGAKPHRSAPRTLSTLTTQRRSLAIPEDQTKRPPVAQLHCSSGGRRRGGGGGSSAATKQIRVRFAD